MKLDPILDTFEIENPRNLTLNNSSFTYDPSYYPFTAFVTKFAKRRTYYDRLIVPFKTLKLYDTEKDGSLKTEPIYELHLPTYDPKTPVLEPKEVVCPICGNNEVELNLDKVAYLGSQKGMMAKVTFTRPDSSGLITGNHLFLLCSNCYRHPPRRRVRYKEHLFYAINWDLIEKIVIPPLELTFWRIIV